MILEQKAIAADIEHCQCHSLLTSCSVKFQVCNLHVDIVEFVNSFTQLDPHLEIYETAHLHQNNDRDDHEVMDYLAAVQNAAAITQDISKVGKILAEEESKLRGTFRLFPRIYCSSCP
jgi:hypothetical protein